MTQAQAAWSTWAARREMVATCALLNRQSTEIDVTVDGDRVTFSAGEATHALDLSVSTPERIEAHWEGFAQVHHPRALQTSVGRALTAFRVGSGTWARVLSLADCAFDPNDVREGDYIAIGTSLFTVESPRPYRNAGGRRSVRARRYNKSQRRWNRSSIALLIGGAS